MILDGFRTHSWGLSPKKQYTQKNEEERWERGWRRAIARPGVKEVKAQLNILPMNLDTHFFQNKVLSPFNLKMKMNAIFRGGEAKSVFRSKVNLAKEE